MIERFTHFRLPDAAPLVVPPGNPVHRTTGGGSVASFAPLFGGGGFDLYGSERMPQTARVVSLTARLVGSGGARQSQLDAWKAAGGKRGRLFRLSGLNVVTWQYARLAMPDVVSQWDAAGITELTLTWLIYGDTWNGLLHGDGGMDFDATPAEYFDEDLALDYDDSTADTTFELPHHATVSVSDLTLNNDGLTPPLHNAGDARVTNIHVRITPGTAAIVGTPSDPLVLNINDVVWRYTASIALGQSLVVHSGNHSVRLASELDPDAGWGSTLLYVWSTAGWSAGERIYVVLDDGTTFDTEIAAVPSSTSVELVEAIPGNASGGNLVAMGTYDLFVEPEQRMEWMILEPGNNNASLVYAGGGAGPPVSTITFTYWDAYS